MTDEEGFPVPGVRGVEHTADVGLEVTAPTLPELFRRAALGAMWLVLESEPGAGEEEERSVELAGEDLPTLLREWLRTLLLWQEIEAFHTVDASLALTPVPLCSTADGQALGLRARVRGRTHPGPSVREIKGVTFHGLRVAEGGEGWEGTVIFDV